MQSGAFIQLIVLFSGISSRMAALLTESGHCVQGCESACDLLLTVLDVSNLVRLPSPIRFLLWYSSQHAMRVSKLDRELRRIQNLLRLVRVTS